MAEYQQAGKGLKLMFLGAILSVGTVIPLLGGLFGVAGALVTLYGIYVAAPAHEMYKTALYMELASVVVSVLKLVFKSGFMGGVVTILAAVVSFCITYFVCTASGVLLAAKGDQVQADRARLIVLLCGICTAVSVVVTLVSWIPLVNILAAIAGAMAVLVALAVAVLQVIFYYQASQSLLG